MAGVALTPQERNDVLRQVGAALAAATLDDWMEIQFTYRAVVDHTSGDFVVVRPDRSTLRLPPPRKAMRLMDGLRPGMYEPIRGVWFTADYGILPDGRYRVNYDYDNEPTFPFDLYSGSFAKDLAQFPRDGRNVPVWLQQKLEIASDWD